MARKTMRPDQISELTIDALSDWFSRSGTTVHLDRKRTLKSYGVEPPLRIFDLSRHVAEYLTKETGIAVHLPLDWAKQYINATVGEYAAGTAAQFVSALPGKPTTGASGPLPGRSTIGSSAPITGKSVSRSRRAPDDKEPVGTVRARRPNKSR